MLTLQSTTILRLRSGWHHSKRPGRCHPERSRSVNIEAPHTL